MLHSDSMGASEPSRVDASLDGIVTELARLLPAQGPIGVFVHHNPLHSFEHLPFEDAVVQAGRWFGCAPFLAEKSYQQALTEGRIEPADVTAVLEHDLGSRATESVAGVGTRLHLRRLVALHGIPEATGKTLGWLLGETAALTRFRSDRPAAAVPVGGNEAALVGSLWQACIRAIERASPGPERRGQAACRHRDLLLQVRGIDTDAWVHPPLIRFLSAYLDQGLAYWPLPAREQGIYRCFLATYGSSLAALCGRWARSLPAIIRAERAGEETASSSLRRSLVLLGVPEVQWKEFLTHTALALPGWAGMIRQVEQRPDRVPSHAPPARLTDYLAVRLLLERCALQYALAARLRLDLSLSQLRSQLASSPLPATCASLEERAWSLFQLAQLCGLDGTAVDRLGQGDVAQLEAELEEFAPLVRRSLLQRAYERQLRRRLYQALVTHDPVQPDRGESIQALFCVDDREESIRRHLEEVDPAVETFGVPGYFGVPMYYRGATDAHPRPLCPVALQPQHLVEEEATPVAGVLAHWRRLRRRGSGFLAAQIYVASRTLVRGTLLMTTVGAASVLPLLLRVLFPWCRQRLRRAETGPLPRLRIEREGPPAPAGLHVGFTQQEMAEIVWRQLNGLGLAGRFASLVLVVGHRSSCLNNPHKSAYDCGACGGGPGGANARAFAQMANYPQVRELLARRGMEIPSASWFVAAERNTASSALSYFDEEAVPADLRPLLGRAKASLEQAREREAHERCRRFESVAVWASPRSALSHVEARAADLAQPRPEYGHASNAFCLIGRRSRSRGLFLDRRAFLVSYEPEEDVDGQVLGDIVAAVVPVVVGISLEYYFGCVDPSGYGSGTKLPHNVTSLLGVMDGAQSDLRTGLPSQMVEIHEPVRLTLVIESSREVLARVLSTDATLARLAGNRWIFLARLDPTGGRVEELTADGLVPYRPERGPSGVRTSSADCYRGRRGHLPFERIDAAPQPGRSS